MSGKESKRIAIRFDIAFRDGGCMIEPHFCREWDEDGGCYGTNPDHGLSFDEACDQVAEWHDSQARLWRERKAAECLYYMEGAGDVPSAD